MVSAFGLPLTAWGCLFTALLGAALIVWAIAPHAHRTGTARYCVTLALMLNVLVLFVAGVRYPAALFATLMWATGGEVRNIGYMMLLLIALLANVIMVALSFAEVLLLSGDDAAA